jgi:DNA invertase Pin-like site-specific DNA recombinase
MLIGYVRVSTDGQDTAAQHDALRAAGCTIIFKEKASGGARARPQLQRAIAKARPGDILLVTRLDRLARSLPHLLETIRSLENKGANFRSLNDPIDTSSPLGVLMMQMLGAIAEFERSLISERTRAGIKAAVARGAKPGNPKMISGDKDARLELSIIHKDRYLATLIDGRREWLPIVERLRPVMPWATVLRQIRSIAPNARSFTEPTLVKACKALVKAGYARPDILEHARRMPPDSRVALLLADRLRSKPGSTLRELASWLSKDLREPTPRGGMTWSPEGIRRGIQRARALGLIEPTETA